MASAVSQRTAPAVAGRTETPAARRALPMARIAALGLTGALVAWTFWPSITELVEIWANNPLYSHGYFIPAFAAALLWLRRDQFPTSTQPSLWGFAFVLLGVVMRLAAAYFFYQWPERAALIPVLLGAVVCLLGWGASAGPGRRSCFSCS